MSRNTQAIKVKKNGLPTLIWVSEISVSKNCIQQDEPADSAAMSVSIRKIHSISFHRKRTNEGRSLLWLFTAQANVHNI
jgi:hypothetical protein